MRRLPFDQEALGALCRRRGIRRLSLFGSVLKGTDRADSDIDLLVEFEPGRIPGLMGMVEIETVPLMSEGIVQFLIAFFRDCNDVRGALRQGK